MVWSNGVRMWLGIKLEGWLTIAAIILGPIGAFAIQHFRDERRDNRNRKRRIFQQLLLTLKVPMSPVHVDALNSIPLEFYTDSDVMEAWREYTAHLNDKNMLRNNSQGWGERKFELLVNLAYEAGKSLGYGHIDKATLRVNIYVPQGYEDNEEQIRQIRLTLLQVLRGERPIPATMVGPVQVVAPLPATQILPQPPALVQPRNES
jgi:hypothetical protein